MPHSLFVTIVFAVVLQVSSATAHIPTDRQLDGLYGPVRRVREYTAPVSSLRGGSNQGKRTLASTSMYDQAGNRLSYAFGHDEGATPDPSRVISYKPDGHGNLFQFQTLGRGIIGGGTGTGPVPKAGDKQVMLLRRTFADDGRLLEIQFCNEDGSMYNDWKDVYTYDASGRLSSTETRYLRGGAIVSKVDLTYNPKGTVAEETATDASGKLVYKRTYTQYKYDSRGNWIQRLELNTRGERAFRIMVTRRIDFHSSK